MVAALHFIESYTYRTSSYPHWSVLNLQNIQFPMTLNQIQKFEALNEISVNVYAIVKGIVPMTHWLKEGQTRKLVCTWRTIAWNISELIEDLSRLVKSQIIGNKNKKYFCDRYVMIIMMTSTTMTMTTLIIITIIIIISRCLHYFNSYAKLETTLRAAKN